jgi:hypothetical protein
MRVAIHQPQYWPWPRYLHKVMSADIFVYLDTVQFDRHFQNRNQIKGDKSGTWLTLPVVQRGGQLIWETQVSDPQAAPRHARLLANHYRLAPGYAVWKAELDGLLNDLSPSMCEAAIATTEWMLGKLGCQARRVRASELSGITDGKSQRNASICQALNAKTYLSGIGGVGYLDPADFESFGCDILVQTWKSPEYPQQYPAIGFVPDLSALDLLLNCPDTATEIVLMSGGFEAYQP